MEFQVISIWFISIIPIVFLMSRLFPKKALTRDQLVILGVFWPLLLAASPLVLFVWILIEISKYGGRK